MEDATPRATVEACGQALRIVQVNRAASARGVRPGRTLADAKALSPELETFPDEPAADRRRLETLALWADRFSPVVHMEDATSLLLDVTGGERLFSGERNLLRRVVEGLKQQGFSARCAVADTPGAAWALAHAHPEPIALAEAGATAAALAALPVWSLRIAPGTVSTLVAVGVETVAALLYLPRASLTPRFGEALLERLDQALGNQPEMLTAWRPPPALSMRFALGAPTDRWDVLREAVRRATASFCDALDRRVAGVREVLVTFFSPDVPAASGLRTTTLAVELSQATRSPRHLLALLDVRLEGLTLPAPADAVTIWSREIEPHDGWQDELFVTDASDARTLGDLLDRLALRLGREAVVRTKPVEDHQPERAFRYVPSAARDKVPLLWHSASGSRGSRPLRLLARPVEIEVTCVADEGPPAGFRFRGCGHGIAECVGPERIETGWWRGPHVRRDYYRVRTDTGQGAWIFRRRDTRRWYLHGWFD